MSEKRITLKILFFLLLSDFLETFMQLCFKKSALTVGGFQISGLSDLVSFFSSLLFSPFLWLGFLLVFFTFVVWSSVLSKIDLSVAVPVASSSYILVPIVSIVFLGEKVSLIRWLGILFIVFGVIFVSLSSTKEHKPT